MTQLSRGDDFAVVAVQIYYVMLYCYIEKEIGKFVVILLGSHLFNPFLIFLLGLILYF